MFTLNTEQAKYLHPFTKSDWYEMCSANKFPDGSDPLVGQYGPLNVTVDGEGLQAWMDDHEADNNSIISFDSDDIAYCVDVAIGILKDCKGMIPNHILQYLQNNA